VGGGIKKGPNRLSIKPGRGCKQQPRSIGKQRSNIRGRRARDHNYEFFRVLVSSCICKKFLLVFWGFGIYWVGGGFVFGVLGFGVVGCVCGFFLSLDDFVVV